MGAAPKGSAALIFQKRISANRAGHHKKLNDHCHSE
jgi:hypothetical protein